MKAPSDRRASLGLFGALVVAGVVFGHAGDAGAPATGWLRMTGLPSHCAIDVAQHPDRIAPRPRFASCGPGCRALVLDGQLYGNSGRSYHDGQHAYFVYSTRAASSPGSLDATVFVARDDGRRMLAIRNRAPDCSYGAIDIFNGTFAFAVSDLRRASRRSYPVRAQLTAPIAEWVTPTSARPVINDRTVRAYTSSTTSVFKAGLSERHYRLDSEGRVSELAPGATLSSAQVHGDTVLLSILTADGWRNMTIGPDDHVVQWGIPTDVDPRNSVRDHGEHVRRRDAQGPEAETGGVFAPRTDGQVLTWHQLYHAAQSHHIDRVELWAGSWPGRQGRMAARRLHTYATPYLGTPHGLGFGRVWSWEETSPERWQLRIGHLDGRPSRVWRAPTDRAFAYPPIVGPSSIGLYIGHLDPRKGLETIRWYRYDALPLGPDAVQPPMVARRRR